MPLVRHDKNKRNQGADIRHTPFRSSAFRRSSGRQGSAGRQDSAGRQGFFAVALAVAVLSGCGTSTESTRGYETAQRIVAKADVAPQASQPGQRLLDQSEPLIDVAGTNCERTITTDEYGFEEEHVDCGGESEPTASESVPIDPSESALLARTDSVSTSTGTGAATDGEIATTQANRTPSETASRANGLEDPGTGFSTNPKPSIPKTGQTPIPTAPHVATTPPVSAPMVPQSTAISIDDVLNYEGFLPTSYYSALAATAPATLQNGLANLGSGLDLVESHCGRNRVEWERALGKVTRTATILAAKTETDPSYPGSPEAKALARSIVERGLHESGCASPGARALDVSATSSALKRTEELSTAIVALDNALRKSSNGPLFHQYSTYPNYLWLRNETVPTDIALVGSSQVGAGLDVKAINERFDREFGSVQLPGGLAEVQQWWLPEVTKMVDPSTIVWFIGPLDLFTGCDISGRKEQYMTNHQARIKTFARNGWLSNHDALDRIIGAVTPDATVRGDAPKRPSVDADGLKNQRKQYLNDFNDFCSDRASLVQTQVTALANRGRRVIVIGMPVHPELTSARSGGAASVSKDMTRFAESSLAGAEFIDLTDTMQTADPWSDLTHLTQPGSVQFTDHVMSHLEAAGIR